MCLTYQTMTELFWLIQASSQCITRKKPHKYLLMSSAEWPALKEEVGWFTNAYLEHHTGRSVDDNWVSIKSAILNAIENNIPTRTSSGRNDQPWISPSIRRKCRKKHRMYKQKQKTVMTPKRKGHLDPLKSQLNVRSDIHGQNL